MRTALASAVILLVVLVAGPSTGTASSVTSTSLEPAVTVIGTTAQHEEVAAAVRLFADAGLRLPDLTVRYHAEEAPCRGHRGLFLAATMTIEICSDLPFVPAHELAHAYTATNLDGATRQAFTVASGAVAWTGADLDWNDRGIEKAAFVLQQVLMASNGSSANETWTERTALYETLTGSPVPNPGRWS